MAKLSEAKNTAEKQKIRNIIDERVPSLYAQPLSVRSAALSASKYLGIVFNAKNLNTEWADEIEKMRIRLEYLSKIKTENE